MFYKIKEISTGLYVGSKSRWYLCDSISKGWKAGTLVKVGKVYQTKKPADELCQILNGEKTKYKFVVETIQGDNSSNNNRGGIQ